MATASTRTLWKGAISFGLVHIPVSLHSATAENRARFNLLDKSSMSPVGNKQVNKTTGQDVQKEEVVKGYEVEPGEYVVLTPEEIKAALPKSTQTIEIEAFVEASAIPLPYYNKPYYVTPAGKGQKAYALMRETLKKTGKAGLARVVVSTKQHLAALLPYGDGLVLNLLRWAEEVREMPVSVLEGIEASAVSERELKMAEQLVNDMAGDWTPEAFKDEFQAKIAELVEQKAKAGQVQTIAQPLPGEEVRTSADVIDLTELLKRSLKGKTAAASSKAAAANDEAAAANDEEVVPKRRAAAKKATPSAKTSVKVSPRRKSG